MTPTDTAPALTLPPVPEGCQTRAEYAGQLLRYALQYGIVGLDAEQLRHIDSAAQGSACRLPQELTATDVRLQAMLSQLRHDIAQEQTRRTQAWARIAAQIAGLDTDPDTDHDIADPQSPEESDSDRAAKLLRAALTLIMGPPNGQGGGGRRAPLVPPSNPKGPGGTTVPNSPSHLNQTETLRPSRDDIKF